MYGLPGETLEDWQKDLQTALQMRPEHISAYHLIYEEGTPLWNLKKAHQVEVTRLVHLVKQNQGDVADHRRRLKLIAKTGNPQAQGFIDECNNELAITLAQTSGFVAEEKLREMAKTQLFAQLQLAGRLIAEHESRKLKIFNRAAAKEAYVMIADPCLDHFPEVNYYRGRCLQEGIGCDVSKERALYYYFQSAKNNCDLAKKILKEWSVSSAKNSDLPCIADIYQRIIGDLANPNGHYTGFSPVVEKYPAIFVKCMLSVAEQFDAPAARIMLWQNALQLAPTAKEKSIIEQCMQTFFMRLNQNSEKEIYEFSQAISALSPEQCANFALKFVNDQKLSEQIRSLWIVAAEAKWVSTYGNTASTTLSQLQKYLAHINESDQQSMRTSLQVGTLLSEQKTKMVEEIHEEKPVAVVSDDKSLQKRVDVCGYTGKIDELLLDPIAFTLMSNPGVCEDERIYDRSTFDSLQGKRSPFNPNVTILTFTPVQAIRSKALEFVEGLERAQKNAASASTSSSSSTASISAAVQLTFFAPPQPTAPTAETVVVPVASAPDFNNNDDDDGEAITYPVASKDEPVAFPAIPGQGPTVRSAQYS